MRPDREEEWEVLAWAASAGLTYCALQADLRIVLVFGWLFPRVDRGTMQRRPGEFGSFIGIVGHIGVMTHLVAVAAGRDSFLSLMNCPERQTNYS